jgi:iron complex outermembrane recepter protein
MKQISTLIAVLTIVLQSFAQTQGKISGSVAENFQAATIALLKAKDSTVLKYGVSDKSGKFSFEDLSPGSYLVSVSAVGHQMGYSGVVDITSSQSSVQLPEITLQILSKTMDAVVVTARKPLIEQKIDRTIVNVEASVTNTGSTVLEVLEKAPGVSVDRDGNISLKGKEGVVILLDGRPTQLSNADLANLLRSMNSSQVDQLEIMTNPPARFDAAGNAGVINIKTKKNKLFGYNGSVNLGYGQSRVPKFNEGVNFNYRKGKVNMFTNLNHNYRKSFQELDIQRNFRDKNTKELTSFFDQTARMRYENSNYSGKFGVDYNPSKNTTIGMVVSGNSNSGTFRNWNTNQIYDISNSLRERTLSESNQENSFKSISTNLNFRQVLDTTGRELTADLDYVGYRIMNHQVLSNSYYFANGDKIRKADTLFGHLPQDIAIYSGKADYLHPLKNGARFEAGIKSSWVKTDNNAVYDTVHHGNIMRDFNRSNYFIYEEFINAAYVNMSGALSKRWNAQAGLRVENTSAKGKQVTTGEDFDRNYTQLFPTAFLQYKASDKNSFGLNYGRRIRRPNYQSMNPFIQYLDRYTYEQGNPELKPQFSHNIELSHTFKGFLTTTLNYTNTTDIIQQVIEQNEATNETYVRQSNIASQRQYGISVNAGMPVTKWWRSNLNVNGFHNRYEGVVNNEYVNIDALSLIISGSQQFTLSKSLTAEVSGWFRTPGIESVLRIGSLGMMSVGLSQQVMKGKGTLRLNVRDVFFTQVIRADINYGSVDAAFQSRNDSRVANIGFTYRFSKGKMNGATKKRSSGSAGEEASRVGGGN